MKTAHSLLPSFARAFRDIAVKMPLKLDSSMRPPYVNSDQAVSKIKSGDHIVLQTGSVLLLLPIILCRFLHLLLAYLTAAATPTQLLEALARRLKAEPSLTGITASHLHTEGARPEIKFPEQFRACSLFMGLLVHDSCFSASKILVSLLSLSWECS